MKKHLFLYILMLACFSKTPFAQLQVITQPAKKQPLLQIPMVHITSVESRFMPVHIDMIKPFQVSLPPIVFGDHENAACEHFKKLKATLVLKAERANDIMANLDWETKYAFYATGFTIERSLADSFHFVPVNTAGVSKATNFKIAYHLPDHNDYSGLSFYRIKQNNGDSGFVYSNIVSINGYEATSLKIYPIPASNNVSIDILSKQSGNLDIMVYDPTGKMVQRQSASCTKNGHIAQSVNISKLTAGVYQVKVLMPDKSIQTGKFIKE